MRYGKCVYLCNHSHNEDRAHFHHLQNFPHAFFQSNSSSPQILSKHWPPFCYQRFFLAFLIHSSYWDCFHIVLKATSKIVCYTDYIIIMKAQLGNSWHLSFSDEPHKMPKMSEHQSAQLQNCHRECGLCLSHGNESAPITGSSFSPNQHFTLSLVRENSFLSFSTKCILKRDPTFKIIIGFCPYPIRKRKFVIRYEMILPPSPLLILKYCRLVFKIFSSCSNLKIIWISIFLLTVVLWFFRLLSQVWISGNGHHSFLCLVVFLGCQWQEKCVH